MNMLSKSSFGKRLNPAMASVVPGSLDQTRGSTVSPASSTPAQAPVTRMQAQAAKREKMNSFDDALDRAHGVAQQRSAMVSRMNGIKSDAQSTIAAKTAQVEQARNQAANPAPVAPVASPVLSQQEQLRSRYGAQARRQQGLNFNAANAAGQQAIATSGLDAGSAAAQRLRDRSAAQANVANLEVQNNLVQQEADLRNEDRSNRREDLQLASSIFKNNPKLLQRLGVSALGKDSAVADSLAGVADANGNLATDYQNSAAGAEYDQWVDRYKRQGMSDADANAAALKVMENTTSSMTAGVEESARNATEEAANRTLLEGAIPVNAELGSDLRSNTAALQSIDSAVGTGKTVNVGGKAYNNVTVRYDGLNGRKYTFSYMGTDANGNQVVLGTMWAYDPSGKAEQALQASTGAGSNYSTLKRTQDTPWYQVGG